jgi:hypothetical protein
MTGSYQRLVAHLRAYGRKLFCAALGPGEWEDVRLGLELAPADYAALPLPGVGWLVVTSYPLACRATGTSPDGADLLEDYVSAEGADAVELSEGWAAVARRVAAGALPLVPAVGSGAGGVPG